VVDVQCGFAYQPGSALNAQMSVRYVIAAALLDGQVLPPQFTEQRMRDPQIVELAARLECEHDPKLDALYPAHFAGWVAAEHNGQWQHQDILNPTGSVDNPVDAKGVTEKFRGINPALPVDEIARVALDIENHSVRDLLKLAASGKKQ
jgi:2-methylcitrate dehydratase PrpD